MMTEQIILNSESATKRLILLHGWGADAQDLLPVGDLITQGIEDCFEIVSYSAPESHPSGSGRQWYPLYPHEWEKVPDAVIDLERRLDNLCFEKITLSQTLLIGFSQGGAMALELGSRKNFEGIFALSSYPHPDWHPKKDGPPIFLCHGKRDQVVPYQASQKSFDILKNNGIRSELFFFEGGHEINQEVIDFCSGIIEKNF